MNTNEKRYVENLVKSYKKKEITKLDELKKLDKIAKSGANTFAYIFGSVGSLVLGFGMCVAMEIILGGFMWLGIIVGLLGIFMVTINYFIYKKILENSKNKYASEIIRLSNELINE